MSQFLTWNVFPGVGNFWKHAGEALMQILYALTSLCFSFLDLLQLMFRYVSGLEVYQLKDNISVRGDIFFQIFSKTFLSGGFNGGTWGTDGTYPLLAVAFWSLVILAAILLFVSTIAAVIKNEYSPDKEKKNSKAGIMKNFFKAIASFFLVPIACYFGLRLGNAVLFAIDSAVSSASSYTLTSDDTSSFSTYFKGQNLETSTIDGDSESVTSYSNMMINFFGSKSAPMKYPSISGYVNRTCLSGANRIRIEGSDFYQTEILGGKSGSLGFLDSLGSADDAAEMVDIGFMFNAQLETPYDFASAEKGSFYTSDDYDTWGGSIPSEIKYLNRANVQLVAYYYDLSKFNVILAIGYIFIGGKALMNVVFGLIGRIMTLMGMLFIEPIPLAYMPVDNGGAFGRWTQKFFGQFIALFSINLTMNLFYVVCPVFTSIKFFEGVGNGLGFADSIIQAVFVIAFMSMIPKIDQMILTVLAGEKAGDSVSAMGEKIGADVKSTAQTTGRIAMTGAKMAVGAAKVAGHAVAAAGHLGEFAFNAGRAHGEKKLRDQSRNAAAKTNGQIARDAAAKNVDKNLSKGAGGKDTLGTATAFGNYQANGGKMDMDTWMKNTGADSYMAAKNSGAKNDKELRAYFDAHGGGTDQDFKDWKKEGKQVEKEFNDNESLKQLRANGGMSTYDEAQIADLGGTRKDRDDFRNQAINEERQKINEMASGKRKAETDDEKLMLADYNAGVQKRDMAKHDAAIHEEKYQNAKDWKWKGLRRAGNSGLGVLRSSTGILGSLGGLMPPESRK